MLRQIEREARNGPITKNAVFQIISLITRLIEINIALLTKLFCSCLPAAH